MDHVDRIIAQWNKARPDLVPDAIAIAEALVERGADVNDGYPVAPGSDHLLSALYGAIGHADNIALGRWLLEHGADPNDNESLYHSTELSGTAALKLLLKHGARPAGTNALARALDFREEDKVRLLLEAGADLGIRETGFNALLSLRLEKSFGIWNWMTSCRSTRKTRRMWSAGQLLSRLGL